MTLLARLAHLVLEELGNGDAAGAAAARDLAVALGHLQHVSQLRGEIYRSAGSGGSGRRRSGISPRAPITRREAQRGVAAGPVDLRGRSGDVWICGSDSCHRATPAADLKRKDASLGRPSSHPPPSPVTSDYRFFLLLQHMHAYMRALSPLLQGLHMQVPALTSSGVSNMKA